ncbi:hypothetical protein WN944_026344 [Citrus x changshan-huyou]|uniref:Uncharacterized protein n=1 Tax=Citrus x changshan-huyou TaxID=2935761 RepID=A0AAP0LXW3_9ROSI
MELREIEEQENDVVLPERKTKMKKRKNKKQEKRKEKLKEEAEELLQDPLDVFGSKYNQQCNRSTLENDSRSPICQILPVQSLSMLDA